MEKLPHSVRETGFGVYNVWTGYAAIMPKMWENFWVTKAMHAYIFMIFFKNSIEREQRPLASVSLSTPGLFRQAEAEQHWGKEICISC